MTRLASPDIEQNFAAALASHQSGRVREAESLYRIVLEIDPSHAAALHRLGLAIYQQGRREHGIDLIRRAIAINPGAALYHANLGNALLRVGRLDEAIASCRRAIDLRPEVAGPHNNLGAALLEQGHPEEAAASFRRAIGLRPDHVEAHRNLAVALTRQGQLEAAAESYRAVIRLRPNDADAPTDLAALLLALGRPEEAETFCRRTIELWPDSVAAHVNLGTALKAQGRLPEAAVWLGRAIDLHPEFAEAHNNLGHVLLEQGQADQAAARFARALTVRHDYFAAWSNLLFTENHMASVPAAELRIMARRFGAIVSRRATRPFTTWHEPAAGAPLRVGLVSGDFTNHPVGHFLEGLLRAADSNRVMFLAFPSHHVEDDLTARIKPLFGLWQPIHTESDEAAARSIHASGAQVLIDLSGHTANNRLPMFAWRPAPVQATWLGFFGTTGVSEIDYIIGDPRVTPPEDDDHFTETVWPLPDICACLTPPSVTAAPGDLPAQSNGYVTFGCFNSAAKINDAVVSVWARVLHAVPDSRLLLKAGQFRDEVSCATIRARFAAHGIAEDRLSTEPPSSRDAYLRALRQIDIALDPFPYPGVTTSFEALWMGVPVLTRRGGSYLSRSGETILANARLPEWIAADDDDYVRKAVDFAADFGRLAAIRAGLRRRVRASPLFDAARFTRHFEDAMWGMWRRHSLS